MKIFNNIGRLSEEGKAATKDFRMMAEELIATAEDVNEIGIISSILSNLIGDVAFLESMKRKKLI